MIPLRQSTASQVILLDRYIDDTDGKTPETGLTVANTDIKLLKHGSTTLVSKNSGGGTHLSEGAYYCTLDATDTDTVGQLTILPVVETGALPVPPIRCFVYEPVVYDALFANNAPGFTTLASIIEGTTTLQQAIGICAAFAGGKTNIVGSLINFRNLADTLNRIASNVTANERTSVTFDFTDM